MYIIYLKFCIIIVYNIYLLIRNLWIVWLMCILFCYFKKLIVCYLFCLLFHDIIIVFYILFFYVLQALGREQVSRYGRHLTPKTYPTLMYGSPPSTPGSVAPSDEHHHLHSATPLLLPPGGDEERLPMPAKTKPILDPPPSYDTVMKHTWYLWYWWIHAGIIKKWLTIFVISSKQKQLLENIIDTLDIYDQHLSWIHAFSAQKWSTILMISSKQKQFLENIIDTLDINDISLEFMLLAPKNDAWIFQWYLPNRSSFWKNILSEMNYKRNFRQHVSFR